MSIPISSTYTTSISLDTDLNASLRKDELREEEDNKEPNLVNLEAQIAALFLQGFFSANPGLAMDPDGAGGALTTAPPTETASQILFRMHNLDLILG